MNAMRNFLNWQRLMLDVTNAVDSSSVADDTRGWRKEESKEDIDVCLNCTKTKCSGTNTCFAKVKAKTKK
jgi:hypothetical protein